MKFDKFLKHTQSTFTEPILQESILPYKYWKKYIKQHKEQEQRMDSQEILQKLQHQCYKTDRTFQTELNLKLHSSSWCDTILCFTKMKNKIQIETATDKELVTFSEINQQALYKICKKLQKNGALNMMRFYTEAKTKRTFKFLGNHERMYLKMHLQLHSHQEVPPECPICMEEESLPLVILDCEHYLCITCLMHMARVTQKRGTLYNRLITAGANFSCPICRQYNPLTTVDKYHFYPKEPKNTLNA